jgi:hypothetical protein
MTDEKEGKAEAPFYKSKHYFDLKEATDEVSYSFGLKDTASALAKLAGKSIFNAGLLAGKAGLEVVKNSPAIIAKVAEANLKNNAHKMTDEQIEKRSSYIENNKGKKLF